MEYDVDKIIFDQKSPFQHVQILHSLTFGNMLVLDDLQSEWVMPCDQMWHFF